MKALTEAIRGESVAQRKVQLEMLPKPGYAADWKFWVSLAKDRIAAQGLVDMKTPTRLQWYQILRQRHQFTVFQAVRGALWLAR